MNISQSQSQPQYASYYASPYPVYSHHQHQYFTGALENSQIPSPSTSGSQYSSSPSPQDCSSQEYPLAPSQEPHAQYYLSSHQDQGYEPAPPDYYQAQAQVFTHAMVTYGDPVLVHAHINAQEAYQHQRPHHQNHSSHHHPFPIQQIDQMPMPLPSCQEPVVYLEPHPRHSNSESIYAYPTPPPSAYPTPPSSDSSSYEYADPKPTPAPVQLAPPQAQPSNAVLGARFGGQLAERSHSNIYAGGSGGGLGMGGGMGGGMAPTTANFRAPNTNRRPRPRPRPSNPSISGSSTIILGDRRLSSSVSSTSEFYFSSLLSSTPLLSSKHKTIQIPHPYARLHAKKDEVKRRKIWNHALEKSIFSPYELSTLGAPQRRKIYIASLEAHIDRLHTRLLELGFWPVNFSELEPFKGLNSKTAKSMVSGLQYDSSGSKLKLLELERANGDLGKLLANLPPINSNPTTHEHATA